MTRSASGNQKSGTAALWFGSVAAALMFIAIALQVRVGWTPLLRLDSRVAGVVNRYVVAHRWQIDLWNGVSTVLSPILERLVALAVGIALWVRDAMRSAVFVIVAVEGAGVRVLYLSDVVGGWLLAIAWLLALTGLLPRTGSRRSRQSRPRPAAGPGPKRLREG